MRATPAQIAAYVGKSERTIHRWLASGKWEFTRLPGGLIEIDDALLIGPESEQESQVLSALRRLEQKIDALAANVAMLSKTDKPRAQPARRIAVPTTPFQVAGNMPAELVVARVFAEQHGIADTTGKRAFQAGLVPVIEGSWIVGHSTVRRALDAGGRRAFYQHFSGRPGFVSCPDCPHS